MYLAHLPSGYLLGKILQKKIKTAEYLPYFLIGSVAPDFDLIYVELFNYSQDHRYLPTHTLFLWLGLFLFLFLVIRLFNLKLNLKAFSFFFLAVLMHLSLDTIVGEIMWLYPFSNETFGILNSKSNLHWVVLAESLVILPSFWLFYRNLKAYKKEKKEEIYQIN